MMSSPKEFNPSHATGESVPKLVLAIVCNSMPPYRVHLHLRIVREIPGIRLASLCTNDPTDGRWPPVDAASLGLVEFGPGEPTSPTAKLQYLLSDWRKGGRIIAWLKAHWPCAVIVSGYYDAARLRVIFWCRRRGIPCFLSGDSNLQDDTVRGVRRRLKNLLLPRIVAAFSAVLPFGTRGRDFFLKYGAHPDRIFYLPLEPDCESIENVSPTDISTANAAFALPSNRRRLMYSGRLIELKRIDTLIDAFAAIGNDRPEWDLLVVGEGPLAQSLQDRVPAALRSRVYWTGGIRDPKMMAALYRGSDVLVLPSQQERWGLVINEAAAAGLAIVSTIRPGAVAELVQDGVNGRLFNAGDVPALVECLLDVTRPDRINAMKAASKAVLHQWRNIGDPIQGLTKALTSVGVLSPQLSPPLSPKP